MTELKLPRGAKAAIRSWLALDGDRKRRRCPFANLFINCDSVCRKAFPRTRRRGSRCPCHEYTMDYVIRRAKELTR